ncbi:Carbohydrate binding module (family 6) [Noviherbaspirillum humi]|uniref:Carbohydrate binding module (Family 6) n=1 Tax=Noviherbaspirillum humi TaxID=1688639 RepID=A0A239L630_9BURK|nr:carbohydrate-binding protein [Noviherbaspirillum humi]SNT24994.1 Carbohydrate binding module (family 6) [Noviherbaspirillum humi]
MNNKKAPSWPRLVMQWIMGMAAMLLSAQSFAQAQKVDITDKNAAVRYKLREPFDLSTVPSSPIVFPDIIEWTVDGRRIVVYPSIPGNSLDVEHVHSGLHVGPNQIHVQGPLFGYAASDVTGGIVYSLTGGDAGSGSSRLTEKVDIRNKSSQPVSIDAINGLGWLPDKSAPHNGSLEIPDLTGLTVTGTTVAFVQGSGTANALLTDPPFPPLTIYPAATISGFNSFLVRTVTLQPGATLTILTELNVRNTPATPAEPVAFIEGESFTSSRGVTIEGAYLASLDNGDWAAYDDVNFGSGATVFEALVAVDPMFANQKLEIRLDSPTGTKIGEMVMQSTGGFQNFQMQRATLTQGVSGVRKVVFVAVGTYGVGNVDKFRFIPG